jgi:FkbM family methyltransferase
MTGHAGAGRRLGSLIRALIARFPAVRSVVKNGAAQYQIQTLRALTVLRGRGRFLARQLRGRRSGVYELRDSGLKVHVRHGTGDVAILTKIFARDHARNSYEPPAEVAAALAEVPAPKILDVGANVGMFGVFALTRWPGARITGFEPDPDNFHALSQTVAANDVDGRWKVVPAAVSNAPGELRFVPGLRAEAHLAGGHETDTISVPALDLFEQINGGVDLIKMDIEGGEWEILADPRLTDLDAKAIRLEWHTLHCPDSDAREAAMRLLRAGGFRVFDASHEHESNGVVWAWRAPGAPEIQATASR